ncbi:MAG: hypothetical protein ABH969_06520 [Pseudomonadota bacterium]
MGNKIKISSFHLKNFKAVQDSKVVRFTPLTAFIGDNGLVKKIKHGSKLELFGA